MNMSGLKNVGAYVTGRVGLIPVDSSAGSVNGPAIDRFDFLSAVISVQTGTPSGTPSSFSVAVKVQHSADGSTGWADYVPYTDYDTYNAAPIVASTNTDINVNLAAAKRYIRVVATTAFVAGTSPAVEVGAVVVLGGSNTLPV